MTCVHHERDASSASLLWQGIRASVSMMCGRTSPYLVRVVPMSRVALPSPLTAPPLASPGAARSSLPRGEIERLRVLVAGQCRVLLAVKANLPSPVMIAPPGASGQVPETAGAADCEALEKTEVAVAVPAVLDASLSPRVRQTLDRLLRGDSEKQAARQLEVSPHTLHIYVKTLYRKLKVNSRGELLAMFVRPPR
jgi:DNA-binding CsgD family transcriptional regulator